MALDLFHIAAAACGSLVAMLSGRDRLFALRPVVGRPVSTIGVISLAGIALAFLAPWLAGFRHASPLWEIVQLLFPLLAAGI